MEIRELPDDIGMWIMRLLSIEEAARKIVLSKPWNEVYGRRRLCLGHLAWYSLQNRNRSSIIYVYMCVI